MQLTITRLEPQRRNPDLIELHIDGEFRSTVAFVVMSAERLGVGDAITEDVLDRILAADERWKAKQSALSLLAVRARAKGELEGRLRMKGYGDAAVRSAIADVCRLGLLDDAAFAETWVRDRLRLRPRGTAALMYELGRKRVPADIARSAIARVMEAENVTDEGLCMRAAVRWISARTGRDCESLVMKRRLSAYLARRGYSAAAVRAAVSGALGE
jgi:regulatory protein